MGKIFHVVHSIKGGCGKTAFSLFKSLELAAKAVEQGTAMDDKASVLLLDADFKGTGLQVLVYYKSETELHGNGDIRLGQLADEIDSLGINRGKNYFLFREKYQPNSLNDFLLGRCSTLSEIVTESGVVASKAGTGIDKVEHVTAFNGYLDFVFCSPDLKERQAFGYWGKTQPALSVGRFRVKMKALLREIYARTQYQDIVIDMPAGYDEYSDVLLELLREFCSDRKESQIYYYAVSTADKSHLDAMEEDVLNALIADPVYGHYDKVYVIFSEICEGEFEGVTAQKFIDKIDCDKRNKITFVKNIFQKEYYDFCREKSMENFSYELEQIQDDKRR